LYRAKTSDQGRKGTEKEEGRRGKGRRRSFYNDHSLLITGDGQSSDWEHANEKGKKKKKKWLLSLDDFHPLLPTLHVRRGRPPSSHARKRGRRGKDEGER